MKRYILSPKNQIYYDNTVKNNVEILAAKPANLDSYRDPDKGVVDTYLVNGSKTRFSPDGICGIQYMQEFYAGPLSISEIYRIIRIPIVMWPKHKQSINQRRYACFRDRWDFTLYDISVFYQTGESLLVRKNSPTERYLKSLGTFSDFLDEYEMWAFVSEGKVYNLAVGDGKTAFIESYDDYAFGKECNATYLNNLICTIEEQP